MNNKEQNQLKQCVVEWIRLSNLKQDTTKERMEILKNMSPQKAVQLCETISESITIRACLITTYKVESGNFNGIIYRDDGNDNLTPIHGKLSRSEEKKLWSFTRL